MGRNLQPAGAAHVSGIEVPVPSSRATAKRPLRMIIGVVVFAVGALAGVGIAVLMMPPA
jgi:hypothetical protein